MVVETGSYQGFGWWSIFMSSLTLRAAGAASDTMCVEHEATTKTQPRNGIWIRCQDDLRCETIIASKSMAHE